MKKRNKRKNRRKKDSAIEMKGGKESTSKLRLPGKSAKKTRTYGRRRWDTTEEMDARGGTVQLIKQKWLWAKSLRRKVVLPNELLVWDWLLRWRRGASITKAVNFRNRHRAGQNAPWECNHLSWFWRSYNISIGMPPQRSEPWSKSALLLDMWIPWINSNKGLFG